MTHPPLGPPLLPFADLKFDGVVLRYDQFVAGDPARGVVPAYRFRILTTDEIEVGHISVRIGDTEHVLLYAGHVGYEVRPEARGNRYAWRACRALAPLVRSIRPSVILTADPDNLPSLRTIERLGARFVEEVDVPPHDPQYARGSRRKRRYEWNP